MDNDDAHLAVRGRLGGCGTLLRRADSTADSAGPDRVRGDLGRLRGPAWQQTTHGHYLPDGVDTTSVLQQILDAGLPRPMCNQPLFDRYENLLGYPDLLDADAGVVFEYDGAGRRRIGQHDRDNHREELFEEHGLVVARVTRLGFEHRDALVRRMRRTRERGLRRDRRRDAWTLEIPASWGSDVCGQGPRGGSQK